MATTVVSSSKADAEGFIPASFDQSAAETADLIGDPGTGLRVYVKDFVSTQSAAGTVQLLSGAVVLTGAMPTGAGVPLALPSLHTAQSEALRITSGTSPAKGVFKYKIAP